jgi:tubulin polyglutamylase TTLL6/13
VELAQNYDKMRVADPLIYNFHPKNFILPNQFLQFKEYIKIHQGETFIIKPDQGRQGKGIILTQGYKSAARISQPSVCQEYIPPFLLNGLKFDFRIYVLITSISPFRVYIHNENMVRFCTEQYKPPNKKNLKNSYSHLTNYSLNKDNANFVENEDNEEESMAHKRKMTSVFEDLKIHGVNITLLQQQIDDIIRLTLISVQDAYVQNYQSCIKTQDDHCRLFEILGFDILIDEYAKPWLLEVNKNLSLRMSSSFDTSIKKSVVKGALQIVKPKSSFKRKVLIRQKRLKENPNVTHLPLLYNPLKEFERAKETNWRRLLPIEKTNPSFEIVKNFSHF